ncbi:MAG: SRPBCC domain-containing protein [Balneolaceae bacterium]
MKTQAQKEDKKLILTRDFNTTPTLMFEIWSDCKHLKHWWGPKEWPIDECIMDFREGGEWRYCMRGPNEGDEAWGKAIYQNINKPDKIVYQDHFTDKHGKTNEELPKPLVTVEFEDVDGKTRQVMSMQFNTREECQQIADMGFFEGMTSSLDRVDEYLSSLNQ